MSDPEDRIRQALQSWAANHQPSPGFTERTLARARSRSRRRLAAYRTAVVVVVGVAVGIPLAGLAGGHRAVVRVATQPGPTTASRRVIGTPGGPPVLTSQILLSATHVVAGIPIKGTLVVTNHSRTSISINCAPQYVVVLTNRQIPPDVAFATAFCGGGDRNLVISLGQNRTPLTVVTTYQGCTQTPAQATSSVPACLPGPTPPPLPPGHYEAVLVADGPGFPAPKPVAVTLSIATTPTTIGHPSSSTTSSTTAPPATLTTNKGPATGTVKGALEGSGGPIGSSPQPLSGTITLTDAHGATLMTRVGPDGLFAFAVAPGRYRISGTTSQITINGHAETCGGLMPDIDVSRGTVTNATVYCVHP